MLQLFGNVCLLVCFAAAEVIAAEPTDSAVAHFRLDETTGAVAVDEQTYAGWQGFTDSDRLSASTVSVDATSTSIRLRFSAHRNGTQTVLTFGFVSPWRLRLSSSGMLQLTSRSESNATVTSDLAVLADGERVDLTLVLRSTADEWELIDNLGATHDVATTSLDLDDTPANAGTFYIGRYGSAGTPATAIHVEYVEILHQGASVHKWDFAQHKRLDQTGSKNLTVTGTPVLTAGEYLNIDPTTDSAAGLATHTATAIGFDGVDQYIDLGERAAPTAMSVAAWVQRDDTTARRCISYGNTLLDVDAVTCLWYSNRGAAGEAMPGIVPIDTPTHVAITQEGTSAILYINGNESDTATVGAISTTAVASAIGGLEGTDFWEGVIDDVQIYDRALTPSEIQAIYVGGAPSVEAVRFGRHQRLLRRASN